MIGSHLSSPRILRNRLARQHTSQHRRATLLIGVLVCLLVASSLTALGIQQAIRHRRETHSLLLSRQAEWLLEAGIMRAAASFAASKDYNGETWNPSGALDERFETSVLIEVESTDSQSTVEVIARLSPLGTSGDAISLKSGVGTIQRSHRFVVSPDNRSRPQLPPTLPPSAD